MPAYTTYGQTGDAYLDGVLSGFKWAVDSLTYSFPTLASFYGSSYGSSEQNNNFGAFNASQQDAVTKILGMYSAVANLTFTRVNETLTDHGDLRFGLSDNQGTAW